MSDQSPRPFDSVTRRQVLIGGGLAGFAAFLAACGTAGTATQAPSPSPSPSPEPSPSAAASASASPSPSPTPSIEATPSAELNWANWTYYMDTDPKNANKHPTLDAFKAKYGTVVHYQEIIDDNETFYGTIKDALSQGKDTGWDLIVLTDWMAARLIRQGWIETLTVANIPNVIANLEDQYKGLDWDPDPKFHAPWRSGSTGLGFDSKVTGNVTSLKALYTVDPKTKGKVEYLTEMRDAIGLTMLYNGDDPSKPTRAACDKAIATMQQAKKDGIVRSLKGNSYTEDLKSGDAVLCMAWSSDIVQAQPDKASLQYNLADEGGMLWTDNMMIPKGAAHKGTAELLMNYYYDPEINAQVTASTLYISPCKGVDAILQQKYPDVAKSPLVVPTQDWIARFHIFGALTPDDEKYFNEQFAKVMGVA